MISHVMPILFFPLLFFSSVESPLVSLLEASSRGEMSVSAAQAELTRLLTDRAYAAGSATSEFGFDYDAAHTALLQSAQSIRGQVDAMSGDGYAALVEILNGLMADGCGSGWTTKVVPDFNMLEACNWHDDCYDRCGSTQAGCDTEFKSRMLNICATKYAAKLQFAQRGFCNAQANIYYMAVAKLGKTAFMSLTTTTHGITHKGTTDK